MRKRFYQHKPNISKRKQQESINTRFNRRSLLIGGVSLLSMTGLLGRLYYLQKENGHLYRTLSENNRLTVIPSLPERGRIFDRNDIILADNIKSYRLEYERGFNHDQQIFTDTLDFLFDHQIINQEIYNSVLQDFHQDNNERNILIIHQLDWQQLSFIAVNRVHFPYLQIIETIYRHYPFAHALAHIIGYTGNASPKDIKRLQKKPLPKQLVGKSAIEQKGDEILLGKAGRNIVETNALGQHVRLLEEHKPRIGEAINVTIDSHLQHLIYQHIEQSPGAATILDIDNGDILAMVSSPAFDPNLFARGITQKEYDHLLNNPYKPFHHKATLGLFSPGSTIKPVVALAAMAKNISPDHKIYCNGVYELGDYKYHCWHQHGEMDMSQAIRHSCDIWFYDVAAKIGIDHIHDYLYMMGLGQDYDIYGIYNKKGILPNRKWKRQQLKQPWYQGESLIAAIGQGYMTSNALQLSVMAARLASNKKIIPRLRRNNNIPDFEKLPLPPKSLEYIQQAMFDVVNHPLGTAYKQRLQIDNIAMAGKTGTSQVRRISQFERDTQILENNQLAWRLRDHALFIGFAPFHQPRYAVCYIGEHGGSGSSNAAPIVKEIYHYMNQLGYFNV